MSKKSSLHSALAQAGISQRVRQAIEAALLADQLPYGHPEDVAGCLLRHYGRIYSTAYAKGEADQRARAVVALNQMKAAGQELLHHPEQQLDDLFNHLQLPEVGEAAKEPRYGLPDIH